MLNKIGTKTYANESEEIYRYQIFTENIIDINKHNTEADIGLKTYWESPNQFSDLVSQIILLI